MQRGKSAAAEAAAVELGMPGQLQHLPSPPPHGAKEDLSDSEKEEEEEVVKGEQAGCYTNGSFFLESRNKLTRWLSQTDMVEEVEKVLNHTHCSYDIDALLELQQGCLYFIIRGCWIYPGQICRVR